MKISELRPGEHFVDSQGIRGMVQSKSVGLIWAWRQLEDGSNAYVHYELCAEVTRDESKPRESFPGVRVNPDELPGVSPSDPEIMDASRRAALDVEQFGRAALQRGPMVDNVGPRPGGSRAPRR